MADPQRNPLKPDDLRSVGDHRLITIPVSHYCEKARWALTRLQIPFIEEPHMPPFHRFATRGLTARSAEIPATEKNLSRLNRFVVQRVGGQSVPVLVTETAVLRSSDEILQYVDAIAPPELKLYPTDPQQRQQVDELVESFDTLLAPAVRLWTYSYIMNQPYLVKPLWCQGVPRVEQLLFPITFAWMRSNVVEMYGINPTSAIAAHKTISEIFDRVGALLADGRHYLVGDRFSAADLAFATLAGAVVLVPGYGIKLSALSALPDPMVANIREFQATASGKFVFRLYQEHNGLSLIAGYHANP
jgi:glutathione S-transferase